MREVLRRAALRAAGAALGRRPPPAAPPSRVLVLRPDHLGDLLLTTPALQHLRATLPRAHLTLAVGPWNAEAAAHLPVVDSVLTLDFPYFNRRPKGSLLKPYRVLESEARRISALGFDTALVMRHDFWWGALLAARAGVSRRVGFAHPDALPLLTHAMPEPWPQSEAARCLALAEAFSGVAASPRPGMRFEPFGEERAAVSAWRVERGIASPYAVVHPGAGAPVKVWPPERWATVATALAQQHGLGVVLTGSGPERDLVARVADALPPSVATSPLLDAPLGRLAALLAGAACVLGPDSGVLHLAEAVGAPTVRLFGPVPEARFGPWQPGPRHQVVRASLPCYPCGRLDMPADELPLHPCVRAITVQQVLTAAGRALGAGEG